MPPGARYIRHPLLGLFLLCLVFWPVHAEDWISVRSPHFDVLSNAKPERAVKVALRFERIREVIQTALPDMNLDPGQPIVVFAVKDQENFRELLPQFYETKGAVKPAGIFLRGPERHFVALRLDLGGDTAFHTVFHEYIHLLTSLNLPRLPLWLNEGLAEFYANADVAGELVSLGLPSEAHVQRLRRYELVPLRTLFSITPESSAYREADKASIFYSQSWALTHFLILEESNDGQRPLDRYLATQARGGDPDRALVADFGSLSNLESRLRDYVDGSRFRYVKLKVPSTIGPGNIRVEDLLPSRVAAWQAAFLVRNQRFGEAQVKIDSSLKSNRQEALAYEVLGSLKMSEDRTGEALAAFGRAVHLDSESYLSHYYFAVLTMQSRDRDLDRARVESSLRRSISVRPAFAHTHSALAHLLVQDDSRLGEALASAEEAVRLEPNNVEFLNLLGYAYLKLERPEDAEAVAEQMTVVAGSSQDLELADGLRDSVQQWLRINEAHVGPNSEGYPEVDPDSLSQAAGAVSLEGVIIESGCSPRGALEFIVENADGHKAFRVGNIGAVAYFFAGQPPDSFDPCQDLAGRAARIAYVEDGAQARPISLVLQERRY